MPVSVPESEPVLDFQPGQVLGPGPWIGFGSGPWIKLEFEPELETVFESMPVPE